MPKRDLIASLALRRRDPVWRQAVKLTLVVWLVTFFLFMMPVLIAIGRLPLSYVKYVTLLVGWGLILSLTLYGIAAFTAKMDQKRQVVWMGIAILLVALIYSFSDAATGGKLIEIFMYGHELPPDVVGRTVSNMISYSWLFGLLGTLYAILHANEALRERERQLLEARSMAQEAQLAALRLQLNPHFLFNTLNAISSLIVTERTKDGEAMLGKLSTFLRTALSADESGEIALEQELDTLQTYLEIEAVRFGDRLAIDFHIPRELSDALVPSFILQPLVENAVKHGVARTSDPVLIEVSAEQQGNDLVMKVRNTGGPAVPEPIQKLSSSRKGIGLVNLAKRLDVLYGPKGTIHARAIGGGFVVEVRLPILRAFEEAE
ncbi:sensor histidine kinase [Allosphingosinicella vermicomposti]|uniref:sensor histidine kinase n=1 Tax=Allosphingosinicella vermicomposti TaxID=614671 RepID=UPI000D1069F8|nr:histidine kinase [Allosphingosinicella vermicomposti]